MIDLPKLIQSVQPRTRPLNDESPFGAFLEDGTPYLSPSQINTICLLFSSWMARSFPAFAPNFLNDVGNGQGIPKGVGCIMKSFIATVAVILTLLLSSGSVGAGSTFSTSAAITDFSDCADVVRCAVESVLGADVSMIDQIHSVCDATRHTCTVVVTYADQVATIQFDVLPNPVGPANSRVLLSSTQLDTDGNTVEILSLIMDAAHYGCWKATGSICPVSIDPYDPLSFWPPWN